MKETTPRTISIQSNSFALWGTRTDGPPDPADKTPEERAAERKADEITEGELLVAKNWTIGALEIALRCGLPKPTMRTTVARFSFRLTRVNVFSRAAIAEWERTLRALLQCER